jgi:site-specific DNA-cytosine methylase
MRVLLACEESQAVCKEFRKLGHEAYSCDILPESGGHPEWHIQGDVLEVINNQEWDMMIAFPPCTHLAVSGARHFEQKIKDGRQQKGVDFFMALVNAPIKYIAIENPVGIMSTKYRKPDQCIHPYYFGDSYSKKTCLWLKNLKPLKHYSGGEQLTIEDKEATITHVDKGEFVTFSSGKRMPKWYNDASGKNGGHLRSKTFPGIAKAIAKQFSLQVEHEFQKSFQ